MRLQVFLSHSGACSRRKALTFIQAGKVTVNGNTICEPSYAVESSGDGDCVCLCGQRVGAPDKVYILLNKPKGVVTTVHDPFASKTVMDLLPKNLRGVFPVGRLDKDTTGLLLLTNDGILAHCLMHPSFVIEKIYRLALDKPLSVEHQKHLESGVVLDGRKTSPCGLKKISPKNYEIEIHEGRKRQIRRMFDLLGYCVMELERIRQGPLVLAGLKPGAWRFLDRDEVKNLRRALKIE